MKSLPTARNGVYELYWKFAAKRQAVFEQRASGLPGPWTDDHILQTYKFCNVFRATDRVSQYLIRRVAYGTPVSSPEDRLFQVIAFRLFSKNETWESLCSHLGHPPMIADLINGALLEALETTKARNGKLYTSAFILCANNAYHQSSKHENHLELLKHMFIKEGLGRKLLGAICIEDIYTLLRSFPLMGDFMAYQLAIDLNYTEYVNFSENDFTQPGPGAMRGMRKAFIDLGDLTPAEVILWMVEQQDKEFERFELTFRGLWGRPLHAIDCQGLFCELDKYCREAVPTLVSNRSRIKTRFTPTTESISYFFPPKWGINERIG